MDMEKALLNPGAVFSSPAAVLGQNNLSREQKIRILRRWEYDARDLEVAEEENMGGGPPSILGEILSALRLLGDASDMDHSPPTKHGGE